MTRRRLKNKKSLYLICVLLLSFLMVASLVGVGYALYLNQSNKKGVVTTSQTDTMFASNLLQQYRITSGETHRSSSPVKIKTTENYEISFNVYNASKNNKFLVNPKMIVYDLIIELEVLNGSTDAVSLIANGVEVGNITSPSYTLHNQTLNGGNTIKTNNYKITLTENLVDNVLIRITAIPQTGYTSVTNSSLLYKAITPSTSAEGMGFLCEGDFDDALLETDSTKAHGFNYTISVQNGRGRAVLKYNSNYLKIDAGFIDLLESEGEANEYARTENAETGEITISFIVDSNEQDSYDVFFNRTGVAIPNEETNSWQAVENLISLTSEEIA